MRTSSTLRLVFTSCLLVAAACRGGDDGDDVADDDDTGDDAGDDTVDPDDVTIYQIQQGAITEGDTITIKGVIVTAIDAYGERDDGSRTGTIYVQEPDGGPYSGILVYGGPADQVATLALGDVIDIAGASFTEFALDSDTTGRKTTELQAGDSGTMQITKVSSGDVPEPELVDVIAIAQMEGGDTHPNAQDNEWEKWEGVLIKVENVAQIGGIDPISATENPNFYSIHLTGGFESDTSLTPFPDETVSDTCYASITGLGDYFYNWKVQPRETSALVTGGTGCPAAEEGDSACANGTDDDYDGFTDCEDFSCQDTSAACVTDTTVASVQMGLTTGTVSLSGKVVTSLSKDRKHLWIADSLESAAYGGVYVYRGSSAAELGAEFEVGATVDVTGNVQEYDTGSTPTGDTLTEISSATATFVAAPAGDVEPLATATTADLGSIADGEPYEGVLVQLAHLKITNNNAGNGKMTLVDNDGTNITVDDDIFDYDADAPPNGTCYSTFTAISSLQLVDDIRTLAPRSDADMVVGSGCD